MLFILRQLFNYCSSDGPRHLNVRTTSVQQPAITLSLFCLTLLFLFLGLAAPNNLVDTIK